MVKRSYILYLVFFISVRAFAQLEPLSTQYMHSQLMINPGYAGVRNAFSISLMARHQWMGVKGAPVNYNIGIHSPLNKSKVSLGGAVNSYQVGPVQNNRVNFYYSYVVRLRHNMLLSMGATAIVNHYGYNFSDLQIIDDTDPNFIGEAQNSFKPNAGAGVFLYTPTFYFGLSVPQILNTEFRNNDSDQIISQINRHYYLSTGYGVSLNKELYIKPSILTRFIENGMYSVDVNLQFLYSELFSVGVSYRLNTAVAFIGGLRLNDNINIQYSYDMSTVSNGISKGNHEITLSFDTNSWLKRNRDRMFGKKKKDNTEEAGMRSIRYF